MARRLLIALLAALVPVGAIVAHPQLRRILVEDIQLLYTGTASFLRAPSDPERDALVRLINLPQGQDTEERVKAYLQVASRFNKPYLYAATLREAHRVSLKPPQSGAFSEQKWLRGKVAVAQQVVQIADRMITVDPENAFPYLSKMCALLVIGQRQQAQHTLQRAAQCSRYESYEIEWMRIVGIPALTAETRTFMLSEIPFPHLLDFREAYRYWSEEVNRLEKQGDHAGALRKAEYLTSVARLMLRGQKDMLTPLVAAAILNIVWGRQQIEPKYPIEDADYLAVAQDFARYARQHGRSDLADQTLQTAQEALRFRHLSREAQRKHPAEIGTDPSGLLKNTQTLLARRSAGIVLLWWAFPFAVLWVLGKVLSIQYHTTPSQDGVGSWAIALIGASFPVAVLIAGLLALYPFGDVFNYLMEKLATSGKIFSLNLQELLQPAQVSMAYPVTLLILTALLVPTVRLVRAHKQRWLVWSVIVAPLLTVSVLSTGDIFRWSDNVLVVAGVGALLVVLFGVVSVVALPVYAFFLRRRAPLAFRIGVALLWGVGFVLLTSAAWVWILLWLMVGLSLWTAWAYSLPGGNRSEPSRWLGRFAGAALTLALLCLWLYAVNSYLSLPLRYAQHHLLDRLSTEGEVVLWQELL